MSRTIRIALGIAAAAMLSSGLAAQAPPLPPQPAEAPILRELLATQAFETRVADYAALHRFLEAPLPPLRPTTNMAEVWARVDRLARLLIAARRDAQQGDIITPDVAAMLRRRIATCLPPEDWEDILAEMAQDEDGVIVPSAPLTVNMRWPEGLPYSFVPPQLLYVLPPLPPELQYRIIGRSLVLWDHHANLIVDFVPRAFTT